ncbi:MAG TPA: MucB/RseB C-terminal domain-containing protein [Nitrococcus sp.]|nr:MucB/RseB C-terminal domain-containing protein [Nitrococcus sp.]
MKRANELGAGYCFRLGIIACLLLSAAGLPAQADESPQALLQRMINAVRSTNYVGVCIYRFGDSLQAIRIVHQVKDGQRHERLTSLTGPAREIIRNDAQATYIGPREHAAGKTLHLLDTPLGRTFSGSSAQPIASNDRYDDYDLELNGTGRIAGRTAQRLNIVPHDNFRYGYRLWIDEQNGLLLRSDLVDESGKPLEQIMFTTIKTPETIPDQWLQPTLTGDEIKWQRRPVSSAAVAASGPVWEVGNLPEGFKLTLQERHHLTGGRSGLVEHQLYSDGLASVSVYIREEGKHPFNGWSRTGAVSAFGRTLDGYQIIVVGEVPPVTVQLIGESVRRKADAGP